MCHVPGDRSRTCDRTSISRFVRQGNVPATERLLAPADNLRPVLVCLDLCVCDWRCFGRSRLTGNLVECGVTPNNTGVKRSGSRCVRSVEWLPSAPVGVGCCLKCVGISRSRATGSASRQPGFFAGSAGCGRHENQLIFSIFGLRFQVFGDRQRVSTAGLFSFAFGLTIRSGFALGFIGSVLVVCAAIPSLVRQEARPEGKALSPTWAGV